MQKKKIVVTGATGFIGSKICLELFKQNYEIHILSRNPEKAKKSLPFPYHFHQWDYHQEAPLLALEGAHAVIHLAGEPVAQRWNSKIKQEIYDSRIIGTKNLIKTMEKCNVKPEVVIGASAIGIYGDRGNETLDETSPADTKFLSHVCSDWEAAYASTIKRTTIIRVGVVLGLGGGAALSKMLPPFRLGAGGALGFGKQWTSWIHLDDLVQMFLFALENEKVHGVMNGVAPQPVTNMGLTKAQAKVWPDQ